MRISNNMLEYICSSYSVNEMFLDFENNSSYFNEGSYEEYIKALKSHIITYFENDIKDEIYRMQEERITLTDKLYDLFYKNGEIDILNDKIFSTLRKYKDMINILAVEKLSTFSISNPEMREAALERADKHIKQIDKFFSKYDYENRILEELKKYDEFIDENKLLGKRRFSKFNSLLSNIGIDIPNKYIDLYFKELASNGYQTTYEAAYNVSRSMVSNLAKQKDIYCFFMAGKLDYEKGIYHNGIITISNSHLKDFVANPALNYEDYLETLFHEFTHLVQETNYRADRMFTYNEIKMLEDHLLFETLNSRFGRNNYNNLSYELDAREMSKIMVRRYNKRLGLKGKKDSYKEIRNDKKANRTDLRKMEGKKPHILGLDIKLVPVDYLFDEFIENIINIHKGDFAEDIFEKYPILNLMYDKDGRRYTTLELLKQREEIQSKLSKSKNPDSDINKIFNINEIIYNKDLPFISLVADYKELALDDTLEIGKERDDLLRRLYKKIKSHENSDKFIDFSFFINSLMGNSDKDLLEDVESTLSTGNEMADYFYQLTKDEMVKHSALRNLSKSKAKH